MLNDAVTWRLLLISIHAKNCPASFGARFVQPLGAAWVSHICCEARSAVLRVFVLYLGGKDFPSPIRRLVPRLWLIQPQA